MKHGALAFLEGGGELGRIIADYDWTTTPLGAIAGWPQSLKTTIALILRSPVPIVTLWGEVGIMIYNDAYSVFAGGRHPQLLGSRVREGWPEVADFNDNVMKVGLAGGTLKYEDQELALFRRGSLEPAWMNLDYSPIIGEDGLPVGVIAIVVETTAKVRAERWLSGERDRLRAMFEQAPGFMALLTGPEHEYALANEAYLTLAGHRDLLGKTVAQVLPEAAEQGFVQVLDNVFATGERYVGTSSLFTLGTDAHGQAQSRYLDFVYQPLMDEDGQVMGIFVQGADVTDRVLAEQSLRDLNATLEQQISQRTAERDRMWRLSTDIMLVTDREANIVAANPAFSRVLQWQEDEVIGKPYLDLIHPNDRGAAREEFLALRDHGAELRIDSACLRRDGKHTVIAWSATYDGQFVYAVGRDATAEREAAAAVKRSELALQQAQKMETIGKLTGGVAHDFNNLLQVISGNLQLLKRIVVGNERGQRHVENALNGVNRGAKLASYLLAFGRRQALEPRVVKISRYIVEMEDMLHRSLGEEIEIEMSVSAGLWNTFVDTAQVENAVLNLCINARDAMEGIGKLTLEVGNAFLDDAYAWQYPDVTPGQYVMIAVSDTGCGMTPDVMAQAFEPFFSTKPEGKGTGLGLSMVYGFVKQSGGHVKIYSEPGHGTTVKLYLPRSHEAEDIPTSLHAQAAEGGSETILVAEDDEGVRGTVVEMLTDLGYRVLKANDAASALAIIESGVAIDLLFTDVVMPGPLRSPDLARKARERMPDLVVLFTSGYTENAIVHGGRLDAGVELLGKPYTQEALARKIRHVLSNRAQQQRPMVAPPVGAEPLSTPSKRLKVLLVEDQPQIRQNTAELIEALGHQVIQAADGEQALSLLDATRPDVLITDLGLPGMSGEDLAAAARQRRPELALVVASGREMDTPLQDVSLLRKPYDLPALERVLTGI
ncbi:PAS domain-containing protein [Silvimonas sp. JCM 19000]